MWRELKTADERQAYPWAAGMRVKCKDDDDVVREFVVKTPASPIYANGQTKPAAWVVKLEGQFGLANLHRVVAVWEGTDGEVQEANP